MIKNTLYPKTTRFINNHIKTIITEKLDGSNLCIFKYMEITYVATKNIIYTLEELLTTTNPSKVYKGLVQWLKDNQEELDLYNNACICGEWLGAGHIKYKDIPHSFYMYAKANIIKDINDNFMLTNIIYDKEYFMYSFAEQDIPSCVLIVPTVAEINFIPDIVFLDNLYASYNASIKDHTVEGFVININNNIMKYIRNKGNKPTPHLEYPEWNYNNDNK